MSSIGFRSDSSSSSSPLYSFSPLSNYYDSEEGLNIKSWLMALKDCTKSGSAESRETLKQLIECMPSFPGEIFSQIEVLVNLLKEVASEGYFYDPDLHPLVKEVYSILYPPEDPVDFSSWYTAQPSTPQRSSPLINAIYQK